jgi:hypothetical protein
VDDIISHRTFVITLRGHLFDIIVLNVHETSGDRNDGTKDRFYEELECVFNELLKYCVMQN